MHQVLSKFNTDRTQELIKNDYFLKEFEKTLPMKRLGEPDGRDWKFC